MSEIHSATDLLEDTTAGLSATREGHVLTLVIDRPPVNYFDVELVQGIVAALHRAAADGVRAAVLASAGKHFCAGADLARRSGGGDLDSRLYEAAATLYESPIPVVAAVQGGAIGGGLGLALAADFRVATPQTRFTANFAMLGFHHGFGLTVSLPAVVGPQAAKEMLFSGRSVYGEEAHRWGLCDRLAPAEDLRRQAQEFAGEFAQAGPLAVRAIRATMLDGLGDRIRAATVRELEEQRILARTEDFKEGLRATRDRRTPEFRGV